MIQSYEPRRGDRADARHPVERGAATMLAVLQRNLAIARASSPAAIAAEEPDNPDPEADYAAWVVRMQDGERQGREWALQSLAACLRDDDSPDPVRPLIDPAFAAEFVDAVRRARAAIAAMTGPDPAAAEAARHDVLVRWYADDEEA